MSTTLLKLPSPRSRTTRNHNARVVGLTAGSGRGQETGFAPPRNDAASEVLGAEAGNSVLDLGQA
jgi:hypothetical protein